MPSAKALSDALSPSPRKVKEPYGKSNERLSTGSADISMASQSFDQEETMHSHSMKQEDNTMHDSVNQDDSMHSMSEQNHFSGFYQVGKFNGNETYLSSLSSATFSNQSIMSQSIASTVKQAQNEKMAFLLDPTPEYSNQSMKSELLAGLSPGPSNRSARSFANSIVSASPNSAAPPSPSFNADFDTYFNETVETFQT